WARCFARRIVLQDRRMDLTLLDQTLASAGQPRFRSKQIWEWLCRGTESYEQMSNLPASLRDALEPPVPLSCRSVAREAFGRYGSVKALFSTADGRPVEAVLRRYRYGRCSICIYSQ